MFLAFLLSYRTHLFFDAVKTFESSKIGDPSFIGLECESGNISDCHDGPDESAPPSCQGGLILSDTKSECGSQCKLPRSNSPRSNSKATRTAKWWTLYTSQAIWNFVKDSLIEFRFNKNFVKAKKLKRPKSVDTPDAPGTGDHENYFVKLDLKAHLKKRNNSLVIDNCKSTAVRIRTIDKQENWPNIPDTTLLFSDADKYNPVEILDKKGAVTYDMFYPGVKPNYG